MTDPSISTLEIVRARLADGRTIADYHVHQLVAEIDRLRKLEDAVRAKYRVWTVDTKYETLISRTLRECLEAMGDE